MKTLLNWSEISRRITGGNRSSILKNYSIGCDYAIPYIDMIKEKEQEIDLIIEACILNKKRSKKLDSNIDNAIEELGIKETLKGIMK